MKWMKFVVFKMLCVVDRATHTVSSIRRNGVPGASATLWLTKLSLFSSGGFLLLSLGVMGIGLWVQSLRIKVLLL